MYLLIILCKVDIYYTDKNKVSTNRCVYPPIWYLIVEYLNNINYDMHQDLNVIHADTH